MSATDWSRESYRPLKDTKISAATVPTQVASKYNTNNNNNTPVDFLRGRQPTVVKPTNTHRDRSSSRTKLVNAIKFVFPSKSKKSDLKNQKLVISAPIHTEKLNFSYETLALTQKSLNKPDQQLKLPQEPRSNSQKIYTKKLPINIQSSSEISMLDLAPKKRQKRKKRGRSETRKLVELFFLLRER